METDRDKKHARQPEGPTGETRTAAAAAAAMPIGANNFSGQTLRKEPVEGDSMPTDADGAPRPPYPQLVSTTGFLCDRCGDAIVKTSEAWGQWYLQPSSTPNGKPLNWGFSIVHGKARSPACTLEVRNGLAIGDEALDYLLSADGFTYLLEFFVDRKVDREELSRFLMRLFVPGYEQAFRYIQYAIVDDVHEPRGNRNFLTQSEITRIVNEHREGRFDTYMP